MESASLMASRMFEELCMKTISIENNKENSSTNVVSSDPFSVLDTITERDFSLKRNVQGYVVSGMKARCPVCKEFGMMVFVKRTGDSAVLCVTDGVKILEKNKQHELMSIGEEYSILCEAKEKIVDYDKHIVCDGLTKADLINEITNSCNNLFRIIQFVSSIRLVLDGVDSTVLKSKAEDIVFRISDGQYSSPLELVRAIENGEESLGLAIVFLKEYKEMRERFKNGEENGRGESFQRLVDEFNRLIEEAKQVLGCSSNMQLSTRLGFSEKYLSDTKNAAIRGKASKERVENVIMKMKKEINKVNGAYEDDLNGDKDKHFCGVETEGNEEYEIGTKLSQAVILVDSLNKHGINVKLVIEGLKK